MTARTHGTVYRSTSTATNSTVMVVIANVAVEIRPVLAAWVKVVQPEQQPTAMLRVVHILATTRLVVETHAVEAVTVKRVGRKIAKALVSLTISTKRGSVTPSAMMVHTFLQIMVAQSAQAVLQSGWTATNSTAMVVTANVILLIQPALAVSIQIALSWQKWIAQMQVVNGVDPTLLVMPTLAVHHVPGMLTVAVQSMSPIS